MELTGLMKNKINIVSFSIGVLITIFITGCEPDKKPVEKSSVAKELPAIVTPVFNPDSSYMYVADQVAFGPRVPNTKAHQQCGEYLARFFMKNGGWLVRQEFTAKAFDGTELKLKNIVVSYNLKATKRILLAAHWDTRPFADQDSNDIKKPIDGANDGASGVGILMELARVINLTEKKPDVGFDIILFDGEDYGQPMFYPGEYQNDSWCLGSQHWAKLKHKADYTAYYGILLDMVGAKNATFAREGVSLENAPSVVQNVWSTAERLGYGNHFIKIESPGITDDHTYINKLAMIPMIDIIEYETSGGNYFGSYWHTHNDNMNVIDKTTLKAVGQTLIEVLYREKL
jgi:glutaminyl-peptide cyclotransferase